MVNEIEMDELSSSKRPVDVTDMNDDDDADDDDDVKDATLASWSWAAASLCVPFREPCGILRCVCALTSSISTRLGAWSSALIFFPRALLFAAEEGQTLTPLEGFLALHFGILLAAVSLALMLNVSHPLPEPYRLPSLVTALKHPRNQIPSAQPIPQRLQHAPPSHPLLVPFTSAALLSAFLSYNTRTAGSLPFLFSLCTGTVGIWGLWVVSTSFRFPCSTRAPRSPS